MSKTERQILEELTAMDELERSTAERLMSVADAVPIAKEYLDGNTIRPTILLLDKSASIGFKERDLRREFILAQQHLVNSLLGVQRSREIYFGQILFNHNVDDILNGLSPLCDPADAFARHADVKILNNELYQPSGGTALYDAIMRAIAVLTAVHFNARELGQEVVSSIVVLTDGKDEHSKTSAEALRDVVAEVKAKGFVTRITLVGLGNYDYRAIGNRIGIDEVIDANASSSTIREMIDLVSSRILESDGSATTTEQGVSEQGVSDVVPESAAASQHTLRMLVGNATNQESIEDNHELAN